MEPFVGSSAWSLAQALLAEYLVCCGTLPRDGWVPAQGFLIVSLGGGGCFKLPESRFGPGRPRKEEIPE